MKKRHKTFAALALAALLGAMIACGGGGGGSSESVNYTGETMAAVIDTTGSVDLSKNVFGLMANDPMEDAPSPLSKRGGTYSGIAADPAMAIDLAASYVKRHQPVQPLLEEAEPLRTICDSAVIDTGSVGGDVLLKVCGDPYEIMNNTQYHISVAFVFRDYDDGEEQIDGEMEVYGLFDDFEEDFVDDVKITFRDLTTWAPPTEDSYIDGWVDYDEGGGVLTLVYNLFIVNNLVPDAVWMKNYIIVMNDNLDTVTFDGRLYDFWAGYVDVTTVTPLAIAMHYEGDELVFDDEYPTAGALRLTGASGAWILVEFRDNEGTPELRVTVDLDSDPLDEPLWDWQSSWQEWNPE
jgi:hypothetical protein